MTPQMTRNATMPPTMPPIIATSIGDDDVDGFDISALIIVIIVDEISLLVVGAKLESLF
jgi:hypothetical protein